MPEIPCFPKCEGLCVEWWLKNLKINYDNSYREGFFKYAHLHNFAGASNSAMLSPAFDPELDSLNKDTIPYTITTDSAEGRNYYMKRASYFTMELLSEIPKNELKYLQSNFTISLNNINVQPTVFIDPWKENFYIYFTNVGANAQYYYINLIGTSGIFPPDGHIQITDTATIFCVKARQPYSTGGKGKNTLYTINECYMDNDYSVNYDIEIDTIYTITNSPASGSPFTTIAVPPYSFGYFKIPITADYPPYEKAEMPKPKFSIYPNPTDGSITVFVSELEEDKLIDLRIKIVAADGRICGQQACANGGQLNVSHLSSGIYLIFVELADGSILMDKLIKQ